MGDATSGPVRLSFNLQLRVEFRGATVTSDAGLLLPRELVVAAALLALAVLSAERVSAQPAPEVFPALPRQCLRETRVLAQARCFEPYLQASVRTGRTQEAFDALTRLVHEGELDDCHMLAHHLGHFAYASEGDVVRAIRGGSKRCSNGFYHGAVEAALQSPSGVSGGHAHSHSAVSPATLCTRLRSDRVVYAGCVHGLGHGFMLLTGRNVQASLGHCARLPTAYERDLCEGGVFMENAMSSLDLDEESYQREAPRTCDGLGLAGTLAQGCANQVGEVAMFYFRHELWRALVICEAMPDSAAKAACRQGAEDEGALLAEERREAAK